MRYKLTIVLILSLGLVALRPDVSLAGASRVQMGELDGERSAADVKVEILPFELSRIDKDIIRQFDQAWRLSLGGTGFDEGLVLIFRDGDGTYTARVHHRTCEKDQVTFKWVPNAIAVVHTHPNKSHPWPSEKDKQIADRFKVPMFTITKRGMWAYDPATRTTSRVLDGLDWLDSKKWAQLVESTPGRLNDSDPHISDTAALRQPE